MSCLTLAGSVDWVHVHLDQLTGGKEALKCRQAAGIILSVPSSSSDFTLAPAW